QAPLPLLVAGLMIAVSAKPAVISIAAVAAMGIRWSRQLSGPLSAVRTGAVCRATYTVPALRASILVLTKCIGTVRCVNTNRIAAALKELTFAGWKSEPEFYRRQIS